MRSLLWLAVHGKKVILLVILYSIANIMSYFALSRVDASVYSVLLQLKIVATAAFAVTILGRNITMTKWRALMLLVMGCVLVASPAFNRPQICDAPETGGEEDERVSAFESMLGVGAVLGMVTISGYSAIYFEQILKKTTENHKKTQQNHNMS